VGRRLAEMVLDLPREARFAGGPESEARAGGSAPPRVQDGPHAIDTFINLIFLLRPLIFRSSVTLLSTVSCLPWTKGLNLSSV
jgi:hypothetical protein